MNKEDAELAEIVALHNRTYARWKVFLALILSPLILLSAVILIVITIGTVWLYDISS
jgi:hypothetical protein